MSLILSPLHRKTIRAHAEAAYPNECCGFLVGRAEDDHKSVVALIKADNTRTDAAHHRYLITPEAYLEAERLAESRGLEILGFYHSHPDAPARPSEYDRTHALPACSYVIVSVRDRSAGELTSWVLSEDYERFEEERVRTHLPAPVEGEEHVGQR